MGERPRKLPGPPPAPEILHNGNLRRRGPLCSLESRGSAAAREPAHLWPHRGLTGTRGGLALHSHRSGLNRTESELGWRVGQRCSKAKLTGPRWRSGRQVQTKTKENWSPPWFPFLFLRGSCQEWGPKGGGRKRKMKNQNLWEGREGILSQHRSPICLRGASPSPLLGGVQSGQRRPQAGEGALFSCFLG